MREGCWASVDVGFFLPSFTSQAVTSRLSGLPSGLPANAGDTEYILLLYTLSPFRKTGWLPNNRSWLVAVLDAGKSKSKAPGWWHSGETRSHGAAAAPCGVEGPRAPWRTFMIANAVRDPVGLPWSLTPFVTPPPSRLKPLPKPQLLILHVRR